MKSKKKSKKVKPRIKVAPPSQRHKSMKDYDRKENKKVVKEEVISLSRILDIIRKKFQ